MQHNGCGPVKLQHILDDRFKNKTIIIVGDAFFQRHIHRIVSAIVGAQLKHVTRARKKSVAIFVEGHGHHSIGQVERLLHAIAMMYVNIDVENARMISY